MRRKGDVNGTPAERLARHTLGYDTSTPIINGSHCLLCSYTKNEHDYPVMRADGRLTRVSRVVWEESTGTKLTPAEHVLHECDNPACIEFRHFFLGDQTLNMADMTAKGRRAAGERHGMAKLSAVEVQMVRDDLRAHRLIAEQYGIHPVYVGQLKAKRYRNA